MFKRSRRSVILNGFSLPRFGRQTPKVCRLMPVHFGGHVARQSWSLHVAKISDLSDTLCNEHDQSVRVYSHCVLIAVKLQRFIAGVRGLSSDLPLQMCRVTRREKVADSEAVGTFSRLEAVRTGFAEQIG